MEFMYLVVVFTCMPGESYHRRLGSLLLYLCCVFQAIINSLVGCFCVLMMPWHQASSGRTTHVYILPDCCFSRVKQCCWALASARFRKDSSHFHFA